MRPKNKKDAQLIKKYRELKDMLNSPDGTYENVQSEIREEIRLYKKKRNKTLRQEGKRDNYEDS